MIKVNNAIHMRDKYIKCLEKNIKKLRENYNEMDIENAKLREEVNDKIFEYETYISNVINELEDIPFHF